MASLHVDPTNPHSAIDPNLVLDAAKEAHQETPIRIKPVNVEMEEDGVRIALTIVDTPGFGDGIDNEYRWVEPWVTGIVSQRSSPALPPSDTTAASRKSRAIWNDNTTTFSLKNRESSETRGSGITEFTRCSTSSRRPVTRECRQ